MIFFPGLHQPSDARHFERAFISVNRLRSRRSDFEVRDWIMDSGAFTEVARHGGYRTTVAEYAAEIRRWRECGRMLAAVAQDWMCEPWILQKTGMTVTDHQRLTVERFDDLRDVVAGEAYVLPVLQGYAVADYVRHVDAYGDRLALGQWVGVGSVCKRNSSMREIEMILASIRRERPDLLLHGFGLKVTALQSAAVRDDLHSSDSMAWSYNARRNGRNANDWREAAKFVERIARMPTQRSLFGAA